MLTSVHASFSHLTSNVISNTLPQPSCIQVKCQAWHSPCMSLECMWGEWFISTTPCSNPLVSFIPHRVHGGLLFAYFCMKYLPSLPVPAPAWRPYSSLFSRIFPSSTRIHYFQSTYISCLPVVKYHDDIISPSQITYCCLWNNLLPCLPGCCPSILSVNKKAAFVSSNNKSDNI